MNQNLLIVDDEYEILEGLEELFKTNLDTETGVYAANSAQEALNLLNRIRFDVVLTDIKMPGMNGITLYQKIKENWPRCKTIFLTGFRNFDDLYQIVNDGDVKYILKSEDDELILDTVRQSLLQVEMELKENQREEQMRIHMEKAEVYLRREFIQRFIEGEVPEKETIKSIEELKLNLTSDKPMLVFLVRIESESNRKSYLTEYLTGIMEENLPQKLNVCIHMANQQAVMLIQPSAWESVDWNTVFVTAKGVVEYAQEIMRSQFKTELSAAFLDTPISLMECPDAVIRLKQLMAKYRGNGQGIMLYAKEHIEKEFKEVRDSSLMLKIPLLKSYLEFRKKEEYMKLLDVFMNRLIETESLYHTTALEIYYSIAVLLLQFINEHHLTSQMAFETALFKLTKVDAHENWTEASEYLFQVSEKIFSLLDKNENVLTERALARIVVYIEEHLSEELSLTVLSEVGGFNASYLSRLFKQIKGEGISEYILRKRMELARELLAKTSEKVQDIASKTGYISAHSFTRVFRKVHGISPKEYRELEADR